MDLARILVLDAAGISGKSLDCQQWLPSMQWLPAIPAKYCKSLQFETLAGGWRRPGQKGTFFCMATIELCICSKQHISGCPKQLLHTFQNLIVSTAKRFKTKLWGAHEINKYYKILPFASALAGESSPGSWSPCPPP